MAAVRTKLSRVATLAPRRAASRDPSDLTRLRRLEARVARTLAAVEDELDYRLAVSRWENHLKKKTKLFTGEEVWRELGLPA